MAVRTTFHWTHLDYIQPWYGEANETWGPVAEAVIQICVEILDRPNCFTKELMGVYKRLKIPIVKGMDPKSQIIKAIKDFGQQEDIQIKFDFIKNWEKKKENKTESPWDEPF